MTTRIWDCIFAVLAVVGVALFCIAMIDAVSYGRFVRSMIFR